MAEQLWVISACDRGCLDDKVLGSTKGNGNQGVIITFSVCPPHTGLSEPTVVSGEPTPPSIYAAIVINSHDLLKTKCEPCVTCLISKITQILLTIPGSRNH